MNRTRIRARRRRTQRNRRIVLAAGMLLAAFLISLAFSNLDVFAKDPTGDTFKYYTDVRVDRDDTLWSIAQEYCTEDYGSIKDYIREVRRINNLGVEVQYGQVLMVPYCSVERK
ncbi:MAG: hypothetical protein Q4B57_06920 [Eubacteriales bacterium]|nr:hypothetical protein [Eubacteriales bacterium]